MSNHLLFEEFWEKTKKLQQKNCDKQMLITALSDLNHILDFSAMSESDRRELFHYIRGIGTLIKVPGKKDRTIFFNTVKTMLESSKILSGPKLAWGGVDPDLLDLLKNLEVRLEEIYKCEAGWKKPGRIPAVNIFQKKGILFIYDLLNKSQQDVNTAKKWRDLRIKEMGIFQKNKIARPKKSFEPTPARLISNFAKGLGVNLSEKTILDVVGKKSPKS